jgi:hypothetical protein
MNEELIKSWLRQKKTTNSLFYMSLGAGSLLLGLLVVVFTFWFTYAILWFGGLGVSAASDLVFGHKLGMGHVARLVCSGIFVVLLFVQYFRTNELYWGEYPDKDFKNAPAIQLGAGSAGGLVSLLAYPGTSSKMITDIMLTGPRLVAGAFPLVSKGKRMRRIDEEGCARLLLFLLSSPHLAPYEELRSAGWGGWFGELRDIDGVLFLEKGLLLTPELKEELVALKSQPPCE